MQETNLFTTVFGKLAIYFGRTEIRDQLLAFALILIVSFVLATVLARRIYAPIKRRLPNRRLLHLGVDLLQVVMFPLLGLLVTAPVAQLWLAPHSGLLFELSQVFWLILLIEIVVTILNSNLSEMEARRYRLRFLLPLLIILAILQVLDQMVNLRELASIIVVRLFDSPITVGALFIATIGLYLYTDAVNQLHDFTANSLIQQTNADEGNIRATLLLVRYGLIILGVGVALDQLNLNPTTIAAITGGLSVGIGFGLREVLSNFIAGIFLMFERSLHEGDVIEVDNEISRVEAVSIRSTRVRTPDNVEMIIPNQIFFTSQFKTYTGSDRRVRFHVAVNANYDNDMRRVIQLLIEAAKSVPDVLRDPAPSVDVQEAFSDNAIGYHLHVWSADPMRMNQTRGKVMEAVWQTFDEHEIGLTFPDLELHFNDTLGAKWPSIGGAA